MERTMTQKDVPGEWAIERTWSNPKTDGGFHIGVDAQKRGIMRSHGQGTLEGAHAAIAALEAIFEALGGPLGFTGLVDLRQLKGSPMRAQFVLGRWLHQRRNAFDRVAVYGGRPFEMKMARAVARIAGMKGSVGFFNEEDEARRFVGW